MSPLLTTLLVSGGILVLLMLLFRIERARGRRFFPRMRQRIDQGVESLYALLGRIAHFLGRDAVRHTIHYLFHRLLKGLLGLFRILEHKTDRLLRMNKEIAKRALRKESSTTSKLNEVVAHKADIALTPKEKRQRKEKSIGTKL
jgi:hypothetical protein